MSKIKVHAWDILRMIPDEEIHSAVYTRPPLGVPADLQSAVKK